MTTLIDDPLTRALCSLEGLSVGDAFGEQFFGWPALVEDRIERRALARAPWPYTDDTEMALSLVAVLAERGIIDQDELAQSFALHYDPGRGYGPAMHGLLPQYGGGGDWRALAPTLFGGRGSFGNGAAMRVAPVGAYFADDLSAVVENAARSAEVTHAHPEAIAGAIATAVAAACACRCRGSAPPGQREFLELILPYVPDSIVREQIGHAAELPGGSVIRAAAELGTGEQISAQDTVPFVLWCAAKCLDNYEEALWLTVSGLGDRDTTCAMVGGIVAGYTGIEGIPPAWRQAREPLPAWSQWPQTEDAGD